MKSIALFIRNTLTGGILFLLPLILLIWLFNKVNSVFLIISSPLAKLLPAKFLGLDFHRIVAILLIIVVCFLGGLLFRSKLIQRGIDKIEDNILTFIPGYLLLKSITADSLKQESNNSMTTVFVSDGDSWNIGYLIEEENDFCTVFFPEAPSHNSGEMRIIPSKTVVKTTMTSNVTSKNLKSFGKGFLAHLPKEKSN